MFNLYNVKFNTILDINELHISDSKITCILGESGSGKTTLIKLLNKILSPDKGKILFRNKDIEEIDSVSLRREVIMLSQSPPIFPGTIKDNLLAGLRFSEKPLLEDTELLETLEFINLNKNLLDYADNLSGGEKQRLALGRIILMNPEVFLLDEPSSALDEETEKLIIERIVTYIKQNNKTLIMVTHSKKIALLYSDYIIEIKSGKIIDYRGNVNG